jgi:hypothetical protein
MCICLAETHITEDTLEVEKCLDGYTLTEVMSHHIVGIPGAAVYLLEKILKY